MKYIENTKGDIISVYTDQGNLLGLARKREDLLTHDTMWTYEIVSTIPNSGILTASYYENLYLKIEKLYGHT